MRDSEVCAPATERVRASSPLNQLITDLLTLENECHGCREALPFVDFLAERTTPELCEAVVARAPVVLAGLPLALDPAAVLESLQGGIERALIDVESSVRDLLDAESDAPSVHGLEGERLEDEEVDTAAECVGLLGVWCHGAALLLKSRRVCDSVLL